MDNVEKWKIECDRPPHVTDTGLHHHKSDVDEYYYQHHKAKACQSSCQSWALSEVKRPTRVEKRKNSSSQELNSALKVQALPEEYC